MAGFNNKIMFADNVDFSGTKGQNPNILLDGHLLIGSTATPNIRTGVLTSTGGTLNISYVSPNINLEVANPSSGTVTSVSVVSANGLAGTVATATTTPAITLSTTATGVLSGNGTAISGSAVTQYDVLVGGASNAVSSVGPGTTGQILQSGGNAANPAYSTSTYPSTNAINTLLYASSANVMTALATANDGVLITSNTGAPSWLGAGSTGQVLTATTGSPPSWASPATSGTVTSVSVVSANGLAGTVATATTTPAITLSTTATGVLSGNGTAISGSAVTQYDVLVGGASNAISSVGPGTSGQILQSGGNAANPAYSTSTYPSTNAINTLLYASSANVMAALATANDGVLITSNTGVPSWLANSGTAGWVLTANTGAPPSWQAASGGSGITTIDGDSGSISGSTVQIYADIAALTCGSTVQFVNSGTTSTLNVTDSNSNSMLGLGAGKAGMSGSFNSAFGHLAMAAATSTGSCAAFGASALLKHTSGNGLNSAFGAGCLGNLLTGINNTAAGESAGIGYTSSESNNITIGANVQGTVGEAM